MRNIKSKKIHHDINELGEKLAPHGLDLDHGKKFLLEKYALKVIDWNQRINLISKNDVDHIVDRHIVESLSVALLVDFPMGSKVLDLGTGAGFPGIPLKIARPDLQLVLLDSKRMRILFLRDVVTELNLPKTKVICKRAELLADQKEYQENFHFVLARAVAKLKLLWTWSRPFLASSGQLIAYKGGKISEEISELILDDANIDVLTLKLPAGVTAQSADKRLIIVGPRS